MGRPAVRITLVPLVHSSSSMFIQHATSGCSLRPLVKMYLSIDDDNDGAAGGGGGGVELSRVSRTL